MQQDFGLGLPGAHGSVRWCLVVVEFATRAATKLVRLYLQHACVVSTGNWPATRPNGSLNRIGWLRTYWKRFMPSWN
jgi:hypothetical protein